MLQEVTMIKGKRSKRPRSASPLALTIATSSELSGGGGAVGDGVISDVSPSHSHDEEEEDMANCLILLAKGRSSQPAAEAYQCKTCSKSFSSFQALGGHRASHKKPIKPEEKKPLMREKQERECFQLAERDDSTNLSLQISNRSASSGSPQSKTRVHECSICGAEFGSGQALGGHMRRHRPIPAVASGGVKKARNLLSLDLNLPAPEDDQPESKFPFATKEQVIVFAASPLIDCHY
ncbi:LOW QUALITY PROTEIN: zinc finger protein ZAT5-like [Salvia miltiorrhiza]|uniref:LOW QUALITY PROTEIN: zinc finger protein ZAT5-like n=1 Tax=Salvia miltiorrhiza TaxID=226208 RepID=UPI0025ACC054|nr:LOW QUALITY PROTEIN: zinc finger protein ZAT5-like [Salvia miltiorrhiza]